MQRWSLVCDADIYFKTISQSIFFVGHFCGTLIAGLIGDWFGRKRAFVLTLLPAIAFALASHFVDHPYGWMALRFFIGLTSMAATTLKTVYTVSINAMQFNMEEKYYNMFLMKNWLQNLWLRCKSALCQLNNDYVVCDAFDANRYRNL
jgi:hypothetical protein